MVGYPSRRKNSFVILSSASICKSILVARIMSMAMEKTVVLYPGLAVSHFMPMMQLADVLLDHGYAVSVALMDPAVHGDATFRATVGRVVASSPSLRFHTLPLVQDAPDILTKDAGFVVRYYQLVRRYNDRLRDFLLCCSTRGAVVHAVVVDSMSGEALGVARELGIPGYKLFTSSAAALSVLAQLPFLHAEALTSFRDLGDAPLELSGLPPMPASHLFSEMLEDPESETYKVMISALSRMADADGILVNTFESFEARAVAALRSLPRRMMPPVYCVGPFVGRSIGGEAKERHEYLAWLDGQPDRSVVFLCFGSLGVRRHSEDQLKEIATGLESSGHRFLWVVRAPLGVDDDDLDLDALLPDGFLERTSGRGLVVRLWAPQTDVLRHRATGAFVTHCGWNSVLEAVVAAGVPMLCWPMYSEQKMNKVLMVEEMRVAVEMAGWWRQGLVKAGEVEEKVRLVMESEQGGELRARVAAHREGAAMAWKHGGSSRAAFAQFLSDVEDLRLAAGTK